MSTSRPSPSTAIGTTGPARADASRTAECSTSEQAMGPGSEAVTPQTAALIDSVPPEVNTTWRGRAPKKAATCSRASSRATRTIRPSVWTRPGSATTPCCAHSTMAARASGRRGVVEAWSR